MRVEVILLALTSCVGTFDPDLDNVESSDSSSDSSGGASASISSTTVVTSTVGSNGHGNDDQGGSGSHETADSECGSAVSSTTPVEESGSPLGCGDGAVGAEEECDGDDLANETCLSRGMLGGGTLQCSDDCMFDVSACSLGGDQPSDGLWSACSTYEDCPAGPEWECEDNFCSVECTTTSECGPSPGGTAVTECRLLAPDHPEQGGRCYLSCADGELCPDGMSCWGASYCRSLG